MEEFRRQLTDASASALPVMADWLSMMRRLDSHLILVKSWVEPFVLGLFSSVDITKDTLPSGRDASRKGKSPVSRHTPPMPQHTLSFCPPALLHTMQHSRVEYRGPPCAMKRVVGRKWRAARLPYCPSTAIIPSRCQAEANRGVECHTSITRQSPLPGRRLSGSTLGTIKSSPGYETTCVYKASK